jgi:DNA/RNA-binding domain of Phe-tRNA-synthetase-like protein
VDTLNLCSLRYMVPFGLYDLDTLRPPVALRLGAAGEGYPGIRKEFVNVAGRYCLADAVGPFGNPSSDSDRAKITLTTTRALVVCFLPKDTPSATVREIVDGTAEALVKYSTAENAGPTHAGH